MLAAEIVRQFSFELADILAGGQDLALEHLCQLLELGTAEIVTKEGNAARTDDRSSSMTVYCEYRVAALQNAISGLLVKLQIEISVSDTNAADGAARRKNSRRICASGWRHNPQHVQHAPVVEQRKRPFTQGVDVSGHCSATFGKIELSLSVINRRKRSGILFGLRIKS
jgi:hypothetical protein